MSKLTVTFLGLQANLYPSTTIPLLNMCTALVSLFFHWYILGAVGSIALGMDILGYDQNLTFPSWCWINPEVDNALFWQYFTGKLWEMLSYILVGVLYALIKHKLHVQVFLIVPLQGQDFGIGLVR